jgi:hypothetical protein
MATLDDILTAQKNGVVAINTLNQTWLLYIRRQHGSSVSPCLNAKSIVATGKGFAVNCNVISAGTTVGYLYDADALESLSDSARLIAIMKDEGSYRVDCQFTKGLVFVPGTDQSATITYSLD